MGQYYKAIMLSDDGQCIESAIKSFGGNKLMEHAWRGNPMTLAVQKLLYDNPTPLVWCGDYADSDPISEAEGVSNLEHVVTEKVPELIIDGDELKALNIEYTPAGNRRTDYELVMEMVSMTRKHRFAINHDKKEYVDLGKLPESDIPKQDHLAAGGADAGSKGEEPTDTMMIDALALLTASGNGRGGGDYHGTSMNLVGRWAYDRIEVYKNNKDLDEQGYREIRPGFDFQMSESDTEDPFRGPKPFNEAIFTDESKTPQSLFF